MSVTNKQRAFIAEYLTDFNATQAAIRAGYSEKTARSQGQRLLTKADIAAEIEREVSERVMESRQALLRLSEIARFSPGDYLRFEENESGRRYLSSIDLDQLAADGKLDMIREVYHTAHGTRIKFVDPEWALELIAKHLGLFVDRVEHSGRVDNAITTYQVELPDNGRLRPLDEEGE